MLDQKLLKSFSPYPKNYFLTFEGIEGSGKSTQLNHLKNYAVSRGFSVYLLREPGGTLFGEKLREAILGSKAPLNPVAEAMLFASSRAQLLQEKTIPLLESPEKTLVIYDRYLDSSLVYQGRARGLGYKTVLEIHQHYPLTIVPHLTLYLRIDLQTSLERQKKRGQDKDYFEKENPTFYQNLIQGYDEIESLFPTRIKRVNATLAPDEVFHEIKFHFDSLVQP